MGPGSSRWILRPKGGERARERGIGAQESFERIQSLRPELLVEGEPLVRAAQRAGFEPAHMGPATHLATDQPGALERLDVLRRRGERDREGLCELTDGPFAGGEVGQHAAAGGVAEGVEDGVEPR